MISAFLYILMNLEDENQIRFILQQSYFLILTKGYILRRKQPDLERSLHSLRIDRLNNYKTTERRRSPTGLIPHIICTNGHNYMIIGYARVFNRTRTSVYKIDNRNCIMGGLKGIFNKV